MVKIKFIFVPTDSKKSMGFMWSADKGWHDVPSGLKTKLILVDEKNNRFFPK